MKMSTKRPASGDCLRGLSATLVGLKCWCLLQNVIYPPPKLEAFNVNHKLGRASGFQRITTRLTIVLSSKDPELLKTETIYDLQTESFRIFDLKNVSYLQKPKGSCDGVQVVLLVLSAPKNVEKREKLRAQFRKES